MKRIILKKGKEKQPLNRHSYIFSGAVERSDNGISPGEVVRVNSYDGKFIAYGHFNSASGILVRLLEWKENTVIDEEWYRKKILSAIQLRGDLFNSDKTNVFRIIFSEGDFLPGLIVDKFKDLLVVQCHTSGMDRNKMLISQIFREMLPGIKVIYEKSDGDGRKMEGLDNSSGLLYGILPDDLTVKENGILFKIDVASQKTGFYTDQRENREVLKRYIKPGDSVLDLCCYSGGFGLNAALEKAGEITMCDISESAISLARENFRLNIEESSNFNFVVKDCFEYVRDLWREKKMFDIIIADPPKLMPRKKDEMRAVRAYKDLNFNTMKLVKPGGIMFTFSCSGNLSMERFKEMIAYSAKDARRTVQIVEQLHQAGDHPVSVNVPETEYLKGLVLRVT